MLAPEWANIAADIVEGIGPIFYGDPTIAVMKGSGMT
jgi:hypothetical protein